MRLLRVCAGVKTDFPSASVQIDVVCGVCGLVNSAGEVIFLTCKLVF